MGERHAANIAASSRAELAYVVDAAEERAIALAQRFGGRATTDPSVALGDASIDAVIIASPTDTHVDLIMASARAGKAILCEKPIDLDISRVKRCENAITDYKVPIMIGFQRRFDATHLAVKRAIENGEVGDVEVIAVVSRDPQPPPHGYIVSSGGQFHDQMIHDFDMALWLAGASGQVELFAMASNLVDPEIGRLGDSDTAQVLMRFENGSFCRIDCSRRAVYGYDQRVEVFGSQGMVCSANRRQTEFERYTTDSTGAQDRLQADFMQRYAAAYAVELDYFMDAVNNGSRIDSDFHSGKRALLLADAARESCNKGSAVMVNIARE